MMGEFYGSNLPMWHHKKASCAEIYLDGWLFCLSDILRLSAGHGLYFRQGILVRTCKYSCSGHKSGQALFVAQREQPQQRLVCRTGSVGSILEDTVICGYVQRPADMVEPLNAWGAAAAFQILLEGYGMVKQLRTLSLCELPFLHCFLKGGAEHTGITN